MKEFAFHSKLTPVEKGGRTFSLLLELLSLKAYLVLLTLFRLDIPVLGYYANSADPVQTPQRWRLPKPAYDVKMTS